MLSLDLRHLYSREVAAKEYQTTYTVSQFQKLRRQGYHLQESDLIYGFPRDF